MFTASRELDQQVDRHNGGEYHRHGQCMRAQVVWLDGERITELD